MKKILITTGIFAPDIGGPASYTRLLGSEIAHDAKVTVLTYSSRIRDPHDAELQFRVVRVWRRIPWGLRHLLYMLYATMLARKHDVIFSLNSISAGIPAAIAAKVTGKKLFVRVVGDSAWERAATTGRTSLLIDDFQKVKKRGWIGFLSRIQSFVCQKADVIIVPSQYLADMVHGWGVLSEKVRVVYNAVDLTPMNVSKEEARKHIGIPGNIILSIGRLVPWKGFRMLIKIMPQLLAENQFTRLVVVGEGPDMKALSIMVRNLGLERKVFLAGKKRSRELSVYFAAADMFVLNTGYEGFSHQILEAMACGTPVISTAVGGNPEIIHQGENGFMVKYNDEYNLIEAIKTLAQMPELRERFVEEGKETVKNFSVERMVDETKKALGI